MSLSKMIRLLILGLWQPQRVGVRPVGDQCFELTPEGLDDGTW